MTEVNKANLQAVAGDVIELVLRKNADYGDAWRKHGIAGVLVRISDKALRLERLADGRMALVVDERATDTLRDIAGYALLGLLEGTSPATDYETIYRRRAERWAEGRQRTHWEGCWRQHHDCAIAYIERFRAQYPEFWQRQGEDA